MEFLEVVDFKILEYRHIHDPPYMCSIIDLLFYFTYRTSYVANTSYVVFPNTLHKLYDNNLCSIVVSILSKYEQPKVFSCGTIYNLSNCLQL
jgi:hypothetical protein